MYNLTVVQEVYLYNLTVVVQEVYTYNLTLLQKV